MNSFQIDAEYWGNDNPTSEELLRQQLAEEKTLSAHYRAVAQQAIIIAALLMILGLGSLIALFLVL